jgi:hypothetical protein
MNRTAHALCTHGGLVFGALLGIGLFAIAGWMPPVEPGWGAERIAQLFEADRARIRVGVSVMALGSVFFWPFSAAIAAQLRRIEGPHPVLSGTQLACASGTVIAALVPAYVWLAIAFRPGSPSPETLQVLNDFGWLCFVGMYPPALVQSLAIGTCILADERPVKLYPRWIGYLNYWLALAFMVGILVPFFRHGPFGWNGLIGFWFAAVAFFGWMLVLWWATLRAIRTSDP